MKPWKPRMWRLLKQLDPIKVHKVFDVPNYMKVSFAILVVLVVLVGIYPTFFIHLIQTVSMGGHGGLN